MIITILYAEYKNWQIPAWTCMLPFPFAYIVLFITSALPFFTYCGKNLATKDVQREMMTIMK